MKNTVLSLLSVFSIFFFIFLAYLFLYILQIYNIGFINILNPTLYAMSHLFEIDIFLFWALFVMFLFFSFICFGLFMTTFIYFFIVSEKLRTGRIERIFDSLQKFTTVYMVTVIFTGLINIVYAISIFLVIYILQKYQKKSSRKEYDGEILDI